MLQIAICFDQFWTLWSLSGQGQWALLRDLLEGAERLRMIETDLDAIQTTQTIQTGAKRRWFRSSQPPALAKAKPWASGRIFLVKIIQIEIFDQSFPWIGQVAVTESHPPRMMAGPGWESWCPSDSSGPWVNDMGHGAWQCKVRGILLNVDWCWWLWWFFQQT